MSILRSFFVNSETMRKQNQSSRKSALKEWKPRGTYVAVALYPFGADSARLMAVNGDVQKIVLFDTPAMAQQFLPLLGMGRSSHWSADGETISWLPLDVKGINRAVVVTDYDPYDLPANMPYGILSETHGREWKRHIMFSQAFFDCGQFVHGEGGALVNTALFDRA